jgi:UDP-N-acetylglucosamine--N-acetylmuramyl-(pentapeptide) pyrophosphoryl-undecaprenol N-acetylglucosamine transferase
MANLDFLEARDDWQVIHLTGEPDYGRVKRAYEGRSIRVCVRQFTDAMGEALAAADLVVSRAGASTLAEITVVGRASILMPYPHDRKMHQLANARCLERASAASVLSDSINASKNGPALRCALDELMDDDHQRGAMAAAAQRLGRADSAERIAEEIIALVTKRGRGEASESVEGLCRSAR